MIARVAAVMRSKATVRRIAEELLHETTYRE
jgi:hypothetical protein